MQKSSGLDVKCILISWLVSRWSTWLQTDLHFGKTSRTSRFPDSGCTFGW